VNKTASGGLTALHLAALHGHVDCVHLLIDQHADLTAQTLPCAASPMGSIGAGSTPLHYAAAGGEVKCCQASRPGLSLPGPPSSLFQVTRTCSCVCSAQILVSRGADRTVINCNG
jgi:E3 ubiquitin-protein ligase XBAT32/33